MRDALLDFLRASHKADPAMPTNLRQLEQLAGIRIIVTDRADPDDVGFVQWIERLLMDAWCSWKRDSW